jgi:excisionase family DNA binding protein
MTARDTADVGARVGPQATVSVPTSTGDHGNDGRKMMPNHEDPRTARPRGDALRPDRVARPIEPGLSPAEFAAANGISISTVRNWIASGYVRATRVGPRLIRIPASELDRISMPIASRASAP